MPTDSKNSPGTIPGQEHRQLPSWIEGFLNYTSGTQSPEIFRRWAAAMVVASVLERKVFANVFKRTLYPSLYVLLVAGPGIGKTDALRGSRAFMEKVPDLHIAPSSVSRASLTDALQNATRRIITPAAAVPYMEYNSLAVVAEEFGTFLSAYDSEFLSTLNHLYDCIGYTEKKRSMKDPILIPKPQLNMIAATTPAWLGGTLPATAWAEGFSSRLVLIYSGERIRIDPWETGSDNSILEDKLTADLQRIHAMEGKFSFEEEVAHAFKAWYMDECPPQPTHPKLEHYIPRRHIHFLKLCIIMSASRASDYTIRMSDYQAAMNMLLEAEAVMPDVFKSMTYNSDSNVIDECFNFVWTVYSKTKKPVFEHRIIEFLSRRMPSHSVLRTLEVMVHSNMLKQELTEGGRKSYSPAPRSTHD